MLKIKKWYINLIDKEKKNFFEIIFYFFLIALSLVYAMVIFIRNFLYDRGMLSTFTAQKKVISIGNIAWAGSGKTSLAAFLYQRLSNKFKVAVLRRGYGEDEGELLKDKGVDVFSSPSRVSLARDLASRFDAFILDDGFQHRKLNRDLNIVTMASREFRRKIRLIPAGIFREPLSSLKRANILVLNYSKSLDNLLAIKDKLAKEFPHLKMYCCHYTFKKFFDLEGKDYDLSSVKGKKVAAFSAIGYPEGFLTTLKELEINPVRRFIFPDHYQLSIDEFNLIQDNLLSEGIEYLIITHKDKYHLPSEIKPKVNIFILDIDLEIDKEDEFLRDVEGALLDDN